MYDHFKQRVMTDWDQTEREKGQGWSRFSHGGSESEDRQTLRGLSFLK